MEINVISEQVSNFIHLKEGGDSEPLNASKEDIYTHIHTHMLHPKVRMAVMLRQLLEFAGLLQNSIVVREDDLCTIDKSNAELYLKVIGQIMTLYKADPTGMVFSDDLTLSDGTGTNTQYTSTVK